jgi:hypothetical protein
MKLYLQENDLDLEKTNPDGLERLLAFQQMLEDMDAQEAAQKAQRQQKVQAAGAPPPNPQVMAQRDALVKDMQMAIERLSAIGGENVALLGVDPKTLTSVVQANKGITDLGKSLLKQ